MPEGTVSSSSGENSKNGQDLVRALPTWMPKDPGSGNFRLLDVIGRSFDRLDEDIRDTDMAATLQEAQSVPEVEQLALPVGTKPKSGEALDKYRSRALGDFQTLTGEGTIEELITNAAVILGVSVEKIRYELFEPGYSNLKVPLSAVNSNSLTGSEFATIMTNQSAAGYRMDITKTGTFTYINPDAYNSGVFDPDKGYDGLDTNGNPKGNGGTYSGVLS